MEYLDKDFILWQFQYSYQIRRRWLQSGKSKSEQWEPKGLSIYTKFYREREVGQWCQRQESGLREKSVWIFLSRRGLDLKRSRKKSCIKFNLGSLVSSQALRHWAHKVCVSVWIIIAWRKEILISYVRQKVPTIFCEGKIFLRCGLTAQLINDPLFEKRKCFFFQRWKNLFMQVFSFKFSFKWRSGTLQFVHSFVVGLL